VDLPPAAEPTPRQEDLADKVRRDWQVVKRDSKAAAEDVLNVFGPRLADPVVR
jgi:hypothetical protein